MKMRWITDDQFQVAEDTPGRKLRGPSKMENLKIVFLALAAIEATHADNRRINQQTREDGDVAMSFVSEEVFHAQCEAALKVVDALIVCQKQYSFPYSCITAIEKMSPNRASELVCAILMLLIPGFSEDEYERMTDGEAKDVIIALKKISNRRLM